MSPRSLATHPHAQVSDAKRHDPRARLHALRRRRGRQLGAGVWQEQVAVVATCGGGADRGRNQLANEVELEVEQMNEQQTPSGDG